MVEGLFQPIHLVLILAVILIVFGAGKLPEMGGALGRGIREFRSEVQSATQPDPENGPTAQVAGSSTSSPATSATFCTGCGERIPSDAKFCPNCGASTVTDEVMSEPLTPAVESAAAAQESPTV